MQKFKIPLVIAGVLLCEYIAVLILKALRPEDDEAVIITALFFFIGTGIIIGLILRTLPQVVLTILLLTIIATGLSMYFLPAGDNRALAVAMVFIAHFFVMPAGGKAGMSMRGMLEGSKQ